MSVIQVENLSFAYSDSKQVFDQATLTLDKNEHLGLWGHNGCGKTTFFKILTGLLKPQAGSVLWNDQSVTTETEFRKLRLKVGLVLQHPDDQLFFPEVVDDVAFGPLNQGLSQEDAKERSYEALEQLGISHLAHSLSFELSGGQKKLVSLATVLSMKPEVLLLDEPTNGLDSHSRHHLIDIINSIDVPRIIVSHDADLLVETSNRFVTIENHQFKTIAEPQRHSHSHVHFFGAEDHEH